MTRPRKLYVKSFGCQMNVYDSHRMADMLAPEGFAETAELEDADLVILNTCHIREKAADKVYSELGRIRALKAAAARNGRRVTIAVAGCVAQAEGEEIIRRAPAVDLVVGPQRYHRLPGLLARAEREGAVVDTEFPIEDKFDILRAPSREATRARRLRVRHRAGRLRQVLHVLRRALHAWRRGVATGDEDRRRGRAIGRRRRARSHADRSERQRLPWRRTRRGALDAWSIAGARCRTAWNSAPALHHEPPLRHGGEPDRGASRPAEPDAPSAPADAVGFRPHTRAHESPPHPGGLPKSHRAYARRAAKDGVLVRLHRRLPRRERGGFSRDAVAGRRGRLCQRLLL